MTSEEERLYLAELCLEAARWRVDRDDPLCALELEVRDRLRRLSGIETTDAEGTVHGDPVVNPVLTDEDYKALEAAKLNEHLASVEKVDNARRKWESSKVRCSENGRLVWRPRAECKKVPRDTSKGGPGWKWQWMGHSDEKGQKEVNKLSDELWEAHENGNDL